MKGAVRRPIQFEKMLEDFIKDKKDKIFETYKDAIVFAACLGFEKNERQSFQQSSEPIKIHIFKDQDIAVINAIALAETGDPKVMSESEEKKLEIFEEYACGGLEILKNKVYEGSGSQQDNLISLIIDQLAPDENILEGMIDEFE